MYKFRDRWWTLLFIFILLNYTLCLKKNIFLINLPKRNVILAVNLDKCLSRIIARMTIFKDGRLFSKVHLPFINYSFLRVPLFTIVGHLFLFIHLEHGLITYLLLINNIRKPFHQRKRRVVS